MSYANCALIDEGEEKAANELWIELFVEGTEEGFIANEAFQEAGGEGFGALKVDWEQGSFALLFLEPECMALGALRKSKEGCQGGDVLGGQIFDPVD